MSRKRGTTSSACRAEPLAATLPRRRPTSKPPRWSFAGLRKSRRVITSPPDDELRLGVAVLHGNVGEPIASRPNGDLPRMRPLGKSLIVRRAVDLRCAPEGAHVDDGALKELENGCPAL